MLASLYDSDRRLMFSLEPDRAVPIVCHTELTATSPTWDALFL